jgi:ADP-heptose:LPS heptosyltransferase
VERFALLGRKLKQALGARVGLSGAGPYERELCSQIEKGMGRADEACVDSGLKSLVAQLCRADLLVCGNTGVMHMAAGLGTPLIALHGPNPPKKWGPVSSSRRGDAATRRTRVISANLPCSPCLNLGFEFGCDQRPCMEAISGDRVYMECLMVLEQGGR